MSGYEFEADLVTDAKLAAERMGVVLEVAGQLKARGSGSSRGLPDAFLCAGGRMYPLEFKRAKSDGVRAGRFSHDQLEAARRRRKCGVETYAPTTLEHFVALLNWARFSGGPVCQSCPVVPNP